MSIDIDSCLSSKNSARGRLQRVCLRLIYQHYQEGTLDEAMPTSVRFLYYELKQGGYLPDKHGKRRADQDVIDALTHLRKTGLVPWNWISDETRDVDPLIVAPTVRDWLAEAVDRALIDPWPEGTRPMIICESRGVRAALRATARRYRVHITSCNGQTSGHLHNEVAPLLTEKTPVLYFGDLNPAGSDIEAHAQAVLEQETGAQLDWARLAVTPRLVETYNEMHPDRPLEPKPSTDARFKDGRPHDSYECEALGQGVLNRLLAGWLDTFLPEPLADIEEREEAQREEMRALLTPQ
jgi:hypothetical protein